MCAFTLDGQTQAADPALLDELPVLGDILAALPPALKAQLLAAFGVEILWNKTGQQVTSTEADTAEPAAMWDLTNTDRFGRTPHSLTSGELSPHL